MAMDGRRRHTRTQPFDSTPRFGGLVKFTKECSPYGEVWFLWRCTTATLAGVRESPTGKEGAFWAFKP